MSASPRYYVDRDLAVELYLKPSEPADDLKRKGRFREGSGKVQGRFREGSGKRWEYLKPSEPADDLKRERLEERA
jgi:hypothetical protein